MDKQGPKLSSMYAAIAVSADTQGSTPPCKHARTHARTHAPVGVDLGGVLHDPAGQAI
jgi:hypothetical protein